MNCNEVIELLDPLIDGELTDNDEINLTAHFAQCSSCKAEFEDMRKLQNTIKVSSIFAAPESLRMNIRQKIDDEDLSHQSFWSNVKSKLTPIINPVFTHAASAIIGALLVFVVIQQPFKINTLRSEIFDAHINSLTGNNLTAVKSSDKHTVKPWFAGKIKFSPSVPDLKDNGFILQGGRVDYLQDKTVAVLVYLRNKHKINLFISPVASKNTLHDGQWHTNGYNTAYWSDNTFTYYAISDLSPHGLEMFSHSFSTAVEKL